MTTKYVKLFDVSRFKLRFATGISLNAYDIVRYGPLSPKPLYGEPSIGVDRYRRVLVLCNRNMKDLAEILVKDFREGYELNKRIFSGFNKVLGTDFDVELTYFDSYDPDKIFDVFENYGRLHDTFPIIVLPKCARGEYDSIYYRTKAVFLKHNIPSQIVTEELLHNKESYKWSLLSIAVQVYAKMGGVPFGLDRSVIELRSLDPSDTLIAIMGLGISIHPQRRKRGVGFITVYDHIGVWNFMDFEILSMDEHEEMGDKVANLLERSIEKIIQYGSKKNNIIVIHYSGKEVGRKEEESVRNAIQTARSVGKLTSIYLLKIQDSDIVVGYENSPHTTKEGKYTWYPPVGTTFMLKPDVYVMAATGYYIRDKNVASNIRVGLPTTKIISRHREIEVESSINIGDLDLLSTVFGLMRLNYVAMNNPVLREPISIRYSREIAWITLRLTDMEINIHKLTRLRNTMWFL